jgi:PAS domain S-box-containing protein
MKTANKVKTDKASSKVKAVKGTRRSTRKSASSNGKHPPTTYEHAPIGIVEASLEGIHINVNEEFCRIVGYEKEELLGRPLKDFTHEEDYPIDVKMHEELVAGKIPFYRFEKRYLRKDGSDIWVELTRSIVHDEEGKPLYTIGVVLDISERKHVERVLHESVERLRLATEAAQMFTWEWDFQNQSYTLSDSFTQVLGFPTDLLSKNSFETLGRFIPPEDLYVNTEAFKKVVETQKDLHSLQCRVINPEKGQTVWLEISAKIIYDYEGKPERMFGVAQNITEDKQKEEALSESEERFRALVSQATAGIAQSDLDSRLTFSNPRFCEMLGYSEAEILGKTIWELTYTEDLEENKRLFKRMLEQGESYQFEKRFIRKDGSKLWTNVSVSIIRDLAGRAKGGVGVIVDIDKSKQAEAALTEYARQQTALYKLADQLHRTASLDDVFNAALDAILSALQCDRASILLYDDTDIMRFVAWRGLSESYRKATDGHSPWNPDERNPEPISISDVRTAELSDSLKEVIREEGIGSLAFIPLVSNGKLIGKFMLYFNAPHSFHEGDIDLSLTIARQLAFGVDRKRADDALRASEAKLQVELADTKQLQSISSQLIREDNINILYQQIIEAAIVLMRSNAASMQMLYPEKNELRLLAWKGFDPKAAAFWQSVDAESNGSCGEALRTHERVIVTDVETADFIADSEDLEYFRLSGIRAMQSTPLVSRDGHLVGMISTHWHESHHPSERELQMLDVLARQAADLIERKRAEEKLRAKEAELEEIINRTPFMLTRCTRDLRYRFVSRAYAEMIGRTPEEVAGKPLVEIMGEEGLKTISPYIEEVLAGNQVEYEAGVSFQEVGIPFLHVIYTPDRDEQGNVIGWFASIVDITERKRSEEALRESGERYRGIVNQTIGGIAETDLTGKFTMVNARYCEITGYTREKLLNGMRMQDVTHPDDLPKNQELFGRLMTDGESFEIEKRYVRPDGSIVWVHNSVSAIINASGKPQSAVAVVIDVTERKQIEENLRIENERFMRFVNSNIVGILIGNAGGEVILANDYYLNLLGVTRQDFDEGKVDWKKFTPPEWLPADEKAIQELRERGVCEPYEKEYVRGDGSRVPVYIADALLSGPKEEIAAFVIDISERKRAEEALRESEQRYRFIVENTSDGIWWIELKEPMPISLSEDEQIEWYYKHAVIRQCNLGLARMYGYHSVEEVVGLPVRIVMPSENPLNVELSRRFIRSGYRLVDSESREVNKDGRELVFVNNMIGIIEDGKLKGEWGTNRDITERKRAEEALRASEALYRTIARSIPGGGVYVVDKDFRYLVAEGPVTEAFGLSREMLEGHTVSEVFPGERAARMEDRLRQNFAGESVGFETEFNGRVYWTQQAPLQDSIGQAIILTLDITERKRAEEALRQSEERFVQFMQHLPGLAWIKDIQGRYMYANAAAEKAFNTPREKLYGKTDEEIFPSKLAVQFKENDQRALIDGQGVQVVETLEQADGGLHFSLVSKFPIPGPDGNPAWIGGTAFDITERLQAEEALRESEERFSAILRQATAGIVRKSADSRLRFVNEAFCNMLGYTQEELIGKTMWELVHPEDVAENRRSYDRLMAEGIPFKLERRLIREDGSVIWVDASVSPIMDATGKPQSAVAVEVDITGRKQAEEALRELNLQLEDRVLSRTAKLRSVNQTLREEIAERKRVEEALRQSEAAARTNEEKLRTLFDLLPVGISFLDPQGQIIQMNSALTDILKISKEKLLSRAYQSRKYIRANGTPMSPAEFASARALAEEKTIYDVETGIILENGEVTWTNVSAAPVDVADVGAVVVTVDVTDRKRAERALQESHRRLRMLSQRLVEVQEEERRALARELHDRVGQTLAALNINLIIINSQLLGEAAEQIGTRLNDSMKLVAETIALVRDVMTDLRPSVLDDYGLEAAVESHLAQFISRYNISAKFEKPNQPLPRLGPSIEMTFLRIAQEALMNIARHAQATAVKLSLRQEEEMVSLTIQDNGIGIESWQEANRPGSHGLTIMRERAEAFGGNLRVKSVHGQGTTVEVNIPFNGDDPIVSQEKKNV